MRKIIVLFLTVMLIASMTIPVHAATSIMDTPATKELSRWKQ